MEVIAHGKASPAPLPPPWLSGAHPGRLVRQAPPAAQADPAGILAASRGFQGGYRLAQAPDRCTVGDVLRVTEGSIAPVACLDRDPALCSRSEDCITLPVWQGLRRVIDEYLDSITLQDILDGSLAGSLDGCRPAPGA